MFQKAETSLELHTVLSRGLCLVAFSPFRLAFCCSLKSYLSESGIGHCAPTPRPHTLPTCSVQQLLTVSRTSRVFALELTIALTAEHKRVLVRKTSGAMGGFGSCLARVLFE